MQMNQDVIPSDLLPKNDDMHLLIELEIERLTRDLHDELGQILSAIQLNSEAIKFVVGETNLEALRLIEAIQTKIKDAHNAVSEIINKKSPTNIKTNNALKIKKELLTRFEDSHIVIKFGEMDETITLSQAK